MSTPTTSEKFIAAMNGKFPDYKFTVQSGVKFDRIVIEHRKYGHQSVHAFIVKATGGLVKAASWATPAKGVNGLAVRFDLSTTEGLQAAVDAATWSGGYLYAGYVKPVA